MKTIYYCELPTPLGAMQVGISERGICMFEFPIEERIAQHKLKFSQDHEITEICPEYHFWGLQEQIESYFDGKRTTFDLELDFIGTDFQVNVWKQLVEIPFGKTISYLELADQLGDPKSVRAVAHANGLNKLAILVPCHRVIASNGELTGYSGGIWRKEFLLMKERGQNQLIF
jgi:O-6-methylguanine DNA methyltransferase